MSANSFIGPILLAEDVPDIREAFAAVLEAEGYRVLEAHNGIQALALAREHQGTLGLVLLDLVMPGLTGAELLAELGEAFCKEVPVVLVTAGKTVSVPTCARAVLTKPFEMSALLAIVASYGRRQAGGPR